ncbi:MAG: TadE/TadG family type IV pilus assembly protein, partial [Jatrophihabitans sp.]|uniref:TadE/TadG family type IV pilus assembly protein n=1 Tax=Jatrophihabitans sp. TaxID=1932789 RepID=UPI003F7FFB5E
MRRRPRGDDDGNAILEFVFVAVIVMVPLIYVIVAVATVQRSQLAVTQAAREAGRAFATGSSPADAAARVRAAVRLALTDQGFGDDADLRFVPPSAPCTAAGVTPRLAAGAEYAVCVSRRSELPGVPTVLQGRGVTTIGRYLLHVDDFRTGAPVGAPPRGAPTPRSSGGCASR